MLLRVEESTNTSYYTIPPGTALSRILYVTETSNGSAVPASGYILWPYMPERNADGSFRVVLWGRGYSGFTAECAPSHIRNLWYQYSAPYILAMAGYVVVSPDYAGLGVNQTADGRPIYSEFLATRANANDMMYALQAAQMAFSSLRGNFVVMGHSQGAMAAWGAAIRQREQQIEGYLATVVATPWHPDFLQLPLTPEAHEATQLAVYASPGIAHALRSVDPTFNLSSFLTPTGIGLYNLMNDIGGCQSVQQTAFLYEPPDTLQPTWTNGPQYEMYANLTNNARLEIARLPRMVLQATGDPLANATISGREVNRTCEAFPDSPIRYVEYNITGHIDILYAAQNVWMNWIRDRFDETNDQGSSTTTGCTWEFYQPTARPLEAYNQGGFRYFLEYVTSPYQVA